MITKDEGDKMFLAMVPVAFSAASVALGLMALMRSSPLERRAYYLDSQYLVSVRYPSQWHDIREFIQPDNPDIIAIYSEIGPDVLGCLDWVCRNISYRPDIGEWWSFPSETIERGTGDCEDSSILTCSLLRNFANAYVTLGSYQGYGHAWCQLNGQILETSYTRAQPVSDPQDYCPYAFFNDREVVELWPGALDEVFELSREEATKLNLMAEAVECISL